MKNCQIFEADLQAIASWTFKESGILEGGTIHKDEITKFLLASAVGSHMSAEEEETTQLKLLEQLFKQT
jgi:hypothetical protein